MEIPFVLLSFSMNKDGELEKRFLTPFGMIDILFRKIEGLDPAMTVYDIEVEGDTESWIFVEPFSLDFKRALLNFIMGIVEKDIGVRKEPLKSQRLVVRIRGSKTDLTIPTSPGGCNEKDFSFNVGS